MTKMYNLSGMERVSIEVENERFIYLKVLCVCCQIRQVHFQIPTNTHRTHKKNRMGKVIDKAMEIAGVGTEYIHPWHTPNFELVDKRETFKCHHFENGFVVVSGCDLRILKPELIHSEMKDLTKYEAESNLNCMP